MFPPFFFSFHSRTERRPFPIRNASRSFACVRQVFSFFSPVCSPDVIVITFCFCLKQPSINAHSITLEEEKEREGKGSSALLVSLDIFRVGGFRKRLNRKNETDEWRIRVTRGKRKALLSSTGIINDDDVTAVVGHPWRQSRCVHVADQSNYSQMLSRVTFRAGRTFRRASDRCRASVNRDPRLLT